MNGVDVLYIESSFLDKDKERARETAHLTAKEAGELARAAGVKKLQVFHFSPKYSGNEQLLIEEAQNAFNLGSVAGDTDHGSEN
jgi:ribonuclease Z